MPSRVSTALISLGITVSVVYVWATRVDMWQGRKLVKRLVDGVCDGVEGGGGYILWHARKYQTLETSNTMIIWMRDSYKIKPLERKYLINIK